MRNFMDIVKQPQALYETDEHQWMLAQIEHLQSGEMNRVDRANLIQYLSDMTKSDERSLGSAFTVLLMHMLKFQFQPQKASPGWAGTVIEQQQVIEDLLTPSINSLHSTRLYAAAYPRAVRRAAAETRIPASMFPSTCPWTMEQAMTFQPPSDPLRRKRRRNVA